MGYDCTSSCSLHIFLISINALLGTAFAGRGRVCWLEQ